MTDLKMNSKLSVIIPVYNEKSTIAEVLKKVKSVQLPIGKEIIVVDDGSRDGTSEIIKRENGQNEFVVYTSPINLGKGAAVRCGLEYVTGDIVIIQDADLELNPNEYPQLIQPILDGGIDVVYGSRFIHKAKRGSLAAILANRFLALLTNMLYRSKLTDIETAYKVFRKDIIKRVKLRCIGFEFEPEVTAKILRLGYKIKEVPISYHPRTVEEGKKIRWYDGVIAIYQLFKNRFVPLEAIST
jgi:glycosyltransferase involved in cell wall biosynthesis